MRRPALWLVAAVIACGVPPTAVDTSPSPTDQTATAAPPIASATPSLAFAPARSVPPERPRIARNDLSGHIRLLKSGWRPAGRTVVVTTTDGLGNTKFIAVPTETVGEPVPFLELTDAGGSQLRPDGRVVAVAFTNGDDASRIATVDLASGAARWVTADEPGIYDRSPVWSVDGSSIYYGESASTVPNYGDRGLFRVSVDGSLADLGTTLVHGPDRNGGDPVSLSPDGRWLSWTRGQAGGSTDVLDLSTGVNKTFDIAGASGLIAWRAARPRALVVSTGCCAGGPSGRLLIWDDVTGATTELLGLSSGHLLPVGLALWDPTGTRFAVSVIERPATLSQSVRNSPIFVGIFDASGIYRSRIPETQAVWVLAWLPEGVLVVPSSTDATTELRLISESGDSARTIYRTTEPNFRLAGIVSP
jgi:WD40 repeat protein